MKSGHGSYYERLGVPPDATADQIKRAYFRAVRQHPPERDPEGFKALREAWETLKDPRSRREYDSALNHGGEIERLFARAEEALKREDAEAAGRALRRILVLAPENEAARARLAFLCLGQGQHEQASRHLDRLCQRPDPNPVHLYWAGKVRFLWGLREGLDPARVAALQREAMALFQRASRLDPLNAEPLLALARLHHRRDQHDLALQCIEQAVAADGVVDFQDFEALHLACVIHLSREDFAGFERTVRRIEALSRDPEMRRHVGWHFARSAVEAAQAGAYPQAGRLAGAALTFAPGEEVIKRLATDVQDLAGVYREYEQTPADEELLKLLLALELQIAAADGEGRNELLKRWTEVVDLLPGAHPENALKWARYLKERCPHFCARNRELVDQMLRIGQALAPALQQARKAAQDPALPPLLQRLAGLTHDSILDREGTRAAQHKSAYQSVLEGASRMPSALFQKGLATLRSGYPDLARHQEVFLTEALRVAGSNAPKKEDGGASGCACLFFILMTLLAMAQSC